MAPEFNYEDLLPIGQDLTEYRLLSKQGVTTFSADGRQFLKVEPQAISDLTTKQLQSHLVLTSIVAA